MWADIRMVECGLILVLSQAPRDRLQSCYLTLSRSGLSRYPVFLYNYVQGEYCNYQSERRCGQTQV